jgi:nicotinate-nucleotide adenylyltransferase
MQIGLFFGSFNPIHNGHLIIAQSALESTQIQELWFVVSPQNPFKKNKNLLHEFDRLDMVRLAIEDNEMKYMASFTAVVVRRQKSCILSISFM